MQPTKLEAEAMPRVHDFTYPTRQPSKPLPTYVHVLALRSDGVSYICVALHPTTIRGPMVKPAVGGGHTVDFDEDHVGMGLAAPFKRVATTTASVVSLTATADQQENLTIDWTDANGGQGHVFYPASYPLRRPSAK